MYYFSVLLGSTIFGFGVVKILPGPFRDLATISIKQLDTILDQRSSDAEKDRVLVKNLLVLFSRLILFLFSLSICLAIGMLPPTLVSYRQGLPVDSSSPFFFLLVTFGASLPILFIKKKSDYSYWSQLLHALVLDNYNLNLYLYRRELRLHKINAEKLPEQFVMVTGLARGGTTALTNLLFDENLFYSLNYGNMPFLMSPNLWKRFYRPKTSKSKERAHGDKLLFSNTSIEALEEYFFKVLLNDCFIGERDMQTHDVGAEVYGSYLKYQQLFNSGESKRYLAKNNNFLLRYESLRNCNKAFHTLLIFRNPIDHAHSLKKQNENFEAQQRRDPFILQYMNWLGHHEFGLNHKVFDFGKEKTWRNFEKSSLNYWVCVWINYYQHVLDLPVDEKLCLIDYSDLASRPGELRSYLAKMLGMNYPVEELPAFNGNTYPEENRISLEEGLAQQAEQIFSQLKTRSIKL